MKVLIFTDSRGEHKQTFSGKEIFPEKIYKDLVQEGHVCDLMLCPFKWTTTIDFIECIEQKIIDPESYDMMILYTGIVEYSPRPLSNFDLAYDSKENQSITLDRLVEHINGRIINNKRKFMESFIDSGLLSKHLDSSYGFNYDGEDTRSLISIDMLRDAIIPYLKKYNHKILYITCNNIVPDWEGNYILKNPKGRPKNISAIEKYSSLIRDSFTNVIDLSKWTYQDVKKYTVDNMHLTYDGSEWIYKKVNEFIQKNK